MALRSSSGFASGEGGGFGGGESLPSFARTTLRSVSKAWRTPNCFLLGEEEGGGYSIQLQSFLNSSAANLQALVTSRQVYHQARECLAVALATLSIS